MALSIFYTKRAKETITLVYLSIQQKFGDRVANKFIKKTEKTIKLISEQPYMFKESSFEINVRIALITKQTSIFYRVTNDSIHILFFWNNLQEPLSI
ncbi:type II toxin-antitoxin system RelE/ParE family toxin [Pedobacter suwonensis]|uniref:type II toxin-antitoxin system RelE/ParE family toxin n=1 Tax=Pedobacter suwonensis TaxID=332999 RepID=UPI0025EA2BEE|nr:type II toxin-antitoxin system RelE/ParE family toxin [uncultured Pedobacter sp.]